MPLEELVLQTKVINQWGVPPETKLINQWGVPLNSGEGEGHDSGIKMSRGSTRDRFGAVSP